jgi:hypothetical protein
MGMMTVGVPGGLCRGLLTAFVLLCMSPAPASAQDEVSADQGRLRTATIAASAAAAADWASTYHALKHYHVRETNPLLSPMDHEPGAMVAVGALIDAGALIAWNKVMGKRHPKIAVAGLWAMTAFRVYLTAHNIRNTRIATPR